MIRKKMLSILMSTILGTVGLVYTCNYVFADNTAANNAKFKDINADYGWAETAIDYFADKGVISGNGDGCFKPAENVTREQFAKLLVSVFKLPLVNSSSQYFEDVRTNRWSYSYIETARQYLDGFNSAEGKLEFNPLMTVNYKDVSLALQRVTDYTEKDLKNKNIIDRAIITSSAPLTRADLINILYRAVRTYEWDEQQPPKLNVDVPSTSSSLDVVVNGETVRGSKVNINGQAVDVNEQGEFTYNCKLDRDGKNTITIETQKDGKVNKVEKDVNFIVEAPELSIISCPDTTEDDTIIVRAIIKDKNDTNVKAYINDQDVNDNGKASEWVAYVRLHEGKNLLVIRAVNKFGKATEIQKTIVYSKNK